MKIRIYYDTVRKCLDGFFTSTSHNKSNLAFVIACIFGICCKAFDKCTKIKTYHIVKDIHTGRTRQADRQTVTWARQ